MGHDGGMLGWTGDIETLTLENETFRTVVHTGAHAQLTLMRLKPGEDIGWEAHDHLDQFPRIEEGQGELDLNRYSTCSPPEHPDGTVHATRAEADAAEAAEHGH